MKMRRKAPIGACLLAASAAGALALSACDAPSGSAPGAVSQGEAQALEEAAEMLDERRLPEGALPPIDGPGAATSPTTSPTTSPAASPVASENNPQQADTE